MFRLFAKTGGEFCTSFSIVKSTIGLCSSMEKYDDFVTDFYDLQHGLLDWTVFLFSFFFFFSLAWSSFTRLFQPYKNAKA